MNINLINYQSFLLSVIILYSKFGGAGTISHHRPLTTSNQQIRQELNYNHNLLPYQQHQPTQPSHHPTTQPSQPQFRQLLQPQHNSRVQSNINIRPTSKERQELANKETRISTQVSVTNRFRRSADDVHDHVTKQYIEDNEVTWQYAWNRQNKNVTLDTVWNVKSSDQEGGVTDRFMKRFADSDVSGLSGLSHISALVPNLMEFSQVDNFNEELKERSQLPRVDELYSGNVTALTGMDTQLTCRVHLLGNRTVSWLKHGEVHLLAVGRYTYTSDLRFEAVHLPNSPDWILRIRSPTPSDTGVYECQISSTPHISHQIFLTVRDAETKLFGGPDMIVEAGSTINLPCTVKHVPKPPEKISWMHNDEEVSYQGPRPGVSLITDKGEVTSTSIILAGARFEDSGLYSCVPDNAPRATIQLHVIQGHKPAMWSGVEGIEMGLHNSPAYLSILLINSILNVL